MKSTIQRYPIWSFLILNYLISWTFLYPSYQSILENDGITPFALIGFIGAYGPTIAAIIVQYVLDKSKLKTLFKKLIQFKSSFKLYTFVILGPILFYILAYLISASIFNGDFSIEWFAGITSIPIWFLAALPFGPLGEELGWRGFLLPKLLEQHSILKSTLFVGLAWGIWHFVSFTFPGAAIPDFLEISIWTILLYFLNTIALSMTFTYVHLKSNGSVFFAILLHAFFNAASNITFSFYAETEDFSILFYSYIFNLILAGLCGFILIKKSVALKPINT